MTQKFSTFIVVNIAVCGITSTPTYNSLNLFTRDHGDASSLDIWPHLPSILTSLHLHYLYFHLRMCLSPVDVRERRSFGSACNTGPNMLDSGSFISYSSLFINTRLSPVYVVSCRLS
ncbi:unnamed protein product [Periconia digitata]|uniref:Uncharacterized protein n=1 Tax=Periconia digitata TaxID=1303443 RepID=A0A9W4UCG5_9PLEO|nr:unnamed protein product [Periconia digitata]